MEMFVAYLQTYSFVNRWFSFSSSKETGSLFWKIPLFKFWKNGKLYSRFYWMDSHIFAHGSRAWFSTIERRLGKFDISEIPFEFRRTRREFPVFFPFSSGHRSRPIGKPVLIMNSPFSANSPVTFHSAPTQTIHTGLTSREAPLRRIISVGQHRMLGPTGRNRRTGLNPASIRCYFRGIRQGGRRLFCCATALKNRRWNNWILRRYAALNLRVVDALTFETIHGHGENN